MMLRNTCRIKRKINSGKVFMADVVYKSKITKRTILDRLISGFNSIRYSVTEPVLLHIARARYAHLYSDSAESPLVTIAIPTYNRGELLINRTLPSIFAQTYRNIEVLI